MATPWDRAAQTLRADLRASLDATTLRALHRLRPWRHAGVALRQVLLLAVGLVLVLRFGDRPWIWIPGSVLVGVVVFGFTVLLHEVVHRNVFRRRRPHVERALAWLYALPSGLSASQFSRWHLDHHDHLGDPQDPKRAHLTPKRVRRWFKALYFTPALFPIYFAAAGRAAASYPADLQRRIRRERWWAIAVHGAVVLALVLLAGPAVAAKAHLLPVFVVFPAAFALNRLGQHYDIDPADPAHWGTLMRPSPHLWDILYLWSNYHLEHHYFPGVPFYNLPRLHRLLRPFFAARAIQPRSYGGLLWDWLVRNQVPHSRWDQRPVRSSSRKTTGPATGGGPPPARLPVEETA